MNIIAPNMPASDYKTYRVSMPQATHWVDISCEEAECENYANGWKTLVDERNELGMKQAHYIRKESGRGFTEERTPIGGTAFVFRPGQPCFTRHKVRGHQPEIFLVQGGDYRGNPRGIPTVRHKRPEDWVEDFALHQEKVKTILERG
jgi:hypothetical protein